MTEPTTLAATDAVPCFGCGGPTIAPYSANGEQFTGYYCDADGYLTHPEATTVAAARELLRSKGFEAENIETALDSLIQAGLDIPTSAQPDGTSDALMLTPQEVLVLRTQLAQWALADAKAWP